MRGGHGYQLAMQDDPKRRLRPPPRGARGPRWRPPNTEPREDPTRSEGRLPNAKSSSGTTAPELNFRVSFPPSRLAHGGNMRHNAGSRSCATQGTKHKLSAARPAQRLSRPHGPRHGCVPRRTQRTCTMKVLWHIGTTLPDRNQHPGRCTDNANTEWPPGRSTTTINQVCARPSALGVRSNAKHRGGILVCHS